MFSPEVDCMLISVVEESSSAWLDEGSAPIISAESPE